MRALLVLAEPPWPPNSGGAQRSNLILRALRETGDVDVLLVTRVVVGTQLLEKLESEFGVVGVVAPLRRGEHWPWKLVWPVAPRLVDRIAHNLGRRVVDYRSDPRASATLARLLADRHYDVIVGRGLKWTARSGALDHQPVILDVDDLDYDIYRTRLKVPGQAKWRRVIIRRHLGQLLAIVPPLLDRCTALWVTNAADLTEVGKARAHILPNIPFVDPAADDPPSAPSHNNQTVLFVGSLFFRPNVDAIDRFLLMVWPEVKKRVPDASFRIVGKNMTQAQAARWERIPGVGPVGFAEDIGVEYEKSAITVVPIFEGGGTKIKVLESLIHGRTCVVAEHSLRGYEHVLRHKESVWVGTDEADLTEGLVTLLMNPEMRDTWAASGRRLVREEFSFERFSEVVQRAVNNVLSRE